MSSHGRESIEGSAEAGPSSRRRDADSPSTENGISQAIPGVLGCRSVNCFEKIQLQGEGTYGQVQICREQTDERLTLVRHDVSRS